MPTFAAKSRAAPTFGEASPAHARSFHRTSAVRRILHGPQVQPKLTIGAVNDPAEREADRMADEVMRMPEPAVATIDAGGAAPRIRRLCTECEEGLHRKTPLEEEEPLVQGTRKNAGLEERASAIEPY